MEKQKRRNKGRIKPRWKTQLREWKVKRGNIHKLKLKEKVSAGDINAFTAEQLRKLMSTDPARLRTYIYLRLMDPQ